MIANEIYFLRFTMIILINSKYRIFLQYADAVGIGIKK